MCAETVDSNHSEESSPREEPIAEDWFEKAYQELKQLARYQLRGQLERATLDTTVLVHEAYLKLSGSASEPVDRSHFMALCARAMRQVVVDHARARAAVKRGAQNRAVPLTVDLEARVLQVDDEAHFLLQLDAALKQLEANDPRLGRLTELRFFGGYSVEETAGILGVSAPTVKRDSRIARALLLRQIAAG